MNSVVFWRAEEKKEGRMERWSKQSSARDTSVCTGSKLDGDLLPMQPSFQPKCGREALKIQSFSNMTITLKK